MNLVKGSASQLRSCNILNNAHTFLRHILGNHGRVPLCKSIWILQRKAENQLASFCTAALAETHNLRVTSKYQRRLERPLRWKSAGIYEKSQSSLHPHRDLERAHLHSRHRALPLRPSLEPSESIIFEESPSIKSSWWTSRPSPRPALS